MDITLYIVTVVSVLNFSPPFNPKRLAQANQN